MAAKEKPRVEEVLAKALAAEGMEPEREFVFHPLREWAFDCAFPDQKIVIDIQGHRFHSKPEDRRNDYEKVSAATEAGYKVLLYPASKVLTKKYLPLIVEQIQRVLFGVNVYESSAWVTKYIGD